MNTATTAADARHQAAVARSLGWAHESAARGDYADALSWMLTLDAVGHRCGAEDQAARESWVRSHASRTAA